MMGTSQRELPFAAWALAALLVTPLAAAADSVDIRAVAGLPHAGLAGGQAVAWRNVGIVAESDWLDAEVKFASCLPTPSTPRTPSDSLGSACAAAAGAIRQWQPGPSVRIDAQGTPLERRRAPGRPGAAQLARTVARRDAGRASAMARRPNWWSRSRWAGVETFAGYSDAGRAGAGARAAGARRSPASPGTRREAPASSSSSIAVWRASTATIDRTLTLRLVQATAAHSARITVWTIRALDDRTDPWQIGAGLDIGF